MGKEGIEPGEPRGLSQLPRSTQQRSGGPGHAQAKGRCQPHNWPGPSSWASMLSYKMFCITSPMTADYTVAEK